MSDPGGSQERRLAAILSADVAGYSRLMAADEAATVAQLADLRSEVELRVPAHRGRLADFTGDACLAEFPTALDAVQCALALQQALGAAGAGLPEARRMRLRMGAHLGDVRVQDGRLFGDGVNIAARLHALAEPGGLCISGALHDQIERKLEVGFADLGERELKNIPGRVRVWRVLGEGERVARPGRRRALVAAALLAAIGLGLWAVWPKPLGWIVGELGPGEHPPLPDKPSIAVLPFDNLSDDPAQAYFSDGISEDLITDLSKVPHLFVIARNSSFAYKDRATDVTQIGRELGVRYVLEGSVRKVGDRVRVTAQLIDATSGFHLWSERYDRHLDDIFALQDELSREILTAMQIEVRDTEMERMLAARAGSVPAQEAMWQGFRELWSYRRSGVYEARRLFGRAAELDPDYAPAWAMIGVSYVVELGLMFTTDVANLDRAREFCERALELDPDNAQAHSALGQVAVFSGDPETAIAHARRAVAAVPNFDPPYLTLAMAYSARGEYRRAREVLEAALRLNPQRTPVVTLLLGYVSYALGREDEAVALYEEARANGAEMIPARAALAAVYLRRGQEARARAMVAEIRAINPDLTADDFGKSFLSASGPRLDPEELRAVGMP